MKLKRPFRPAVSSFVILFLILATGVGIGWNGYHVIHPSVPVVNYTGTVLPANTTPDRYSSPAKIPRWTRIDTPPGYPTMMRTCLGTDGHYENQYGAIYVVPGDPECRGIDPPK